MELKIFPFMPLSNGYSTYSLKIKNLTLTLDSPQLSFTAKTKAYHSRAMFWLLFD